MSAIGGVLHLDGRPCDRAALDAMACRLQHRAPEGTSIWIDGPAGLVHGRLITTPESADERQPFADAAGLAITFDGRLDNRAELLRALEGAGVRHVAPSGDAALTLALYRACGEASVGRLLGDFAFAIWDAPRRRLFCARDAMGLKPFCYRTGPGFFAFASEVGVLARYGGDTPAINEGMAGEHLVRAITSKQDTLFRDINRLPPAHVLAVDANGVNLRRYWQPDARAEIRYRRDDEYVEHLSALVRDAVAARLRTCGPVGVSLSGGVDSSSVAGIASDLCRAHAVATTGVEAFFFLVPGGDEDAPFFDQVVGCLGTPAHRVRAKRLEPGQLQQEAVRYLDIPRVPNAAMTDRLRSLVRQRGARVALTGIGADEWLGTSPWAYADLLKQGRLSPLARRLHLDAALEGFIGWPAAAKAMLWPLVPKRARGVVRHALGRGRGPAWIDPDFAVRIDLADRLAQHEVDVAFESYEQYDTWHDGTSGSSVHELELLDRSAAALGIEHWHPFYDRRIVEFGLAMPPDQRWRNGRAKDLLRRAMAPYLPPDVAARLSGPSGARLVVEGMDTEGGRALFEDMTIGRLGWVRGDMLLAQFDTMASRFSAADEAFGGLVAPLWSVLSVELWARAVVPGKL
jgi:asparagine synthase (glutamine-hydrolysing)